MEIRNQEMVEIIVASILYYEISECSNIQISSCEEIYTMWTNVYQLIRYHIVNLYTRHKN